MPTYLSKFISKSQLLIDKLQPYLTEKLKTKQGKIVLGVALTTIYLSFKLFAVDIAFWWTKGIPDHYIKSGNLYTHELDINHYGIVLHYNTLTFQGAKPKGWQVRAEIEWSSSGRKCTTRSSWAENPVYIPTRYNSTYYGIDLGDRYIITLPQTTNWHINRCNDKLEEVYLRFFNKDGVSTGPGMTIYGNNIPIAKKRHGYLIDNKRFCIKKDNDTDLLGPFSLRCHHQNTNIPTRIYHDEITEKIINYDFYIDGENWDADD